LIPVKASLANTFKKYAVLLGIMLALPLIGLMVLGVHGEHHFNTLPYYTTQGSTITLDDEAQRVKPFTLTNHRGEPFDSKALEGKVWLAAFFSTNSPHVAQVTKQLLWPNFRYRDESDITTVCFTLDAAHDTPEVLAQYVERNTRYNGFDGKWQFLTGEQADIDAIIAESFMIQRDPSDPNNIATLWLVDSKGYLRGVYHAASEDAIKDAVEDIALLQKEMDEAAYAKKKLAERMADLPPLPVLGPEGHTVPPFALLDSDSVEFSHVNCEGQLRVIDFFFTTCPTICPIMSSQMARLQAGIDARGLTGDVRLMSHSVDPENDTPSKLKAYGERLGQDPEIWTLLTGNKEDIYDLARNGYFLTAIESDTAAGGIFHSDIFALIDRSGRIRGYYDGTDTDEVDQLLEDVHRLWAFNE
jgi:protein SCO1/2